MPKLKLTEREVERIEIPWSGPVDYFDQDRHAPPGFGLRVRGASPDHPGSTRSPVRCTL